MLMEDSDGAAWQAAGPRTRKGVREGQGAQSSALVVMKGLLQQGLPTLHKDEGHARGQCGCSQAKIAGQPAIAQRRH